MIEYKNVVGCESSAKPLIVGPTCVYVATDIQPILDDEQFTGLYRYNLIKYSKDEYIQVQADIINQLNEQLTTVQLAIVELYEVQAKIQQQMQSGGVV